MIKKYLYYSKFSGSWDDREMSSININIKIVYHKYLADPNRALSNRIPCQTYPSLNNYFEWRDNLVTYDKEDKHQDAEKNVCSLKLLYLSPVLPQSLQEWLG